MTPAPTPGSGTAFKTPERKRAANKRWRQANRMKMRAYQINYRARRLGRDGEVTEADLLRLFENPVCRDCGTTRRLTVGHGVPLVYGVATNRPDNLLLHCKSCNNRQGFFVHPDFATDEIRRFLPVWDRK